MVSSTVTVQGVMWGESRVKQITYFSTEEVFMPLGNGIMCHKLYIAVAVCQCLKQADCTQYAKLINPSWFGLQVHTTAFLHGGRL